MPVKRPSPRLFQRHSNSLESLGYASPLDIAASSFSAFRQQCRGVLSYSESRDLYREAESYRQQLQAETRKVLTHSNPQLKHMRYLAIDPLLQEARDYEALFGQRADVYVPQSSVASMFSPAAYLTELYREGKQLHATNKPQHLDKRRPDLQSLTLSQSTQDAEITTLALSNDILLSTIQTHTQETDTQVRENLNNRAYPFDLPYHIPFASIKTALAAQNTRFEALTEALAPSQNKNQFPADTRAAYINHLSPGLCDLLLAPIPSDEATLNNSLQHHFGTTDIEQLSDVEYFCQRVGITRAELDAYLALPGFAQSLNTQSNIGFTTESTSVPPSEYGASYLNTGLPTSGVIAIIDGQLRLDTSTFTGVGGLSSECRVLPSVSSDQLRFMFRESNYTYSIGTISLFVEVNGLRVETRKVHDAYYNWQEFTVPLSGMPTGEIKFLGYPVNGWSRTAYIRSYQDIPAASLVRLSQVIRYSQKTGLSPAALDSVIALSQDGATPAPAITKATLQLTARVLEYQQRYALSEEDALVLAGADINAYAPAGALSQFDRLFNNPPLNDVAFTINNDNDTISFAPTDTTYAQERAVLKRALGVDDAGLATLAAIVDNNDSAWARSLSNLSTLYRVGLLARVHGLNPQELQQLLLLNGKTADLLNQSYVTFADYLDAVHLTSQWLAAQQLSVAELNVMTTNAYPDTITSEIDGFIRTLYQAVKGGEVASTMSLTTQAIDPLHQLLAPHIAAAFGLDNVDSAVVQQVWIEQIAADQSLSLASMAAFCDAIVSYCESDAPTTEESAQLATFSQALGQLAFIIQRWKLSSAALRVAVYLPSALQSNLGDKLSLTLATQQALGRFKALQLCAGEAIGECLTLLATNQLNATALARWLDVPESEVALAATCVDPSAGRLNASQAAFALDWLEQAAKLGVSVQTVADLLASQRDQSYREWQRVAGAVLAGMADPARGQMNTALDEMLSTALCAYFLNTVAPSLSRSISMQNRDDLFCYLLIDNQVSGQISTTRLAEAISSVQLYINRCLQGMEADIVRDQLTESFFTQWDSYNKRYSTWVGVSQLAYYPENYVDPTLRYNQSGLQRQLLNELNQSQLNKDSVETAYLNYLNGFEDVANLKVLCGYHHAAELDKGLSYFVGRSTATPYRYYWRSLNHEASDGAGSYTASAWTDWDEIQGQVNPINDEVRPVIFNNRLYIAWVAQQMVTEGVDVNSEPTQKAQYSLQLSYRKINGSWAPAMNFALPDIPRGLLDGDHPKFNLYLSYHPLSDAILFMLYDPSLDSWHYDNIDSEGPAYGGFIYNDMQVTMVEDSTGDSDADTVKEWGTIYSQFFNNLNSSNEPNKLIRYINAVSFDATVTPARGTNYNNQILSIKNVYVQAEVDNYAIPAKLSYQISADINVDPTQSQSHEQEGFYLVDPNIPPPYRVIEFIPESARAVINESIDDVSIDFELSYRQKFFSKIERDTIREVSSGLNVGYDTLPDGIIFSLHPFNADDPGLGLNLPLVASTNQVDSIELEYARDEHGRIISIDASVTGVRFKNIPAGEYFCWFGVGTSEVTTWSVYGIRFKRIATGFEYALNDAETWYALPSGSSKIQENYVKDIPINGLSVPSRLSVRLREDNSSNLYNQQFTINVTGIENDSTNPSDNIQIIDGDNRASYLEQTNQPKRTRLNTLFAPELINRSVAGLDNVLSWESQQLPEPAPGQGFYADIELAPYDPLLHGTERWFKLHYAYFYVIKDFYTCYEGMLSDTKTVTVRIFYPYPENGWCDTTTQAHLEVEYQSGRCAAASELSMMFKYDPAANIATRMRGAPGIRSNEPDNSNPTEPMDFRGANGLYFWELFYHTPMLAAEKLLQSQDFEETERWLKYVFSPEGYLEGTFPNRRHVDRQWNTRPLEEDTAWDDTQANSTDPDAVAQADPMHYKVATLMKLLDLLIARGDMAYRQLERDTLAEAKMWYLSSQQLLGMQPDLPEQSNWSNPTLSKAASDTTVQQSLRLMERLVWGEVAEVTTREARTANSLTTLFLPSENDKLNGYWQTLEQRLFNLRHNLSIDGQPLTLPQYATPADPKALQSATATRAGGANALPNNATIAIQRFPVMLESARSLVAQLIQYGSTLASVLERKDGEALNVLLQTQAQDLMQHNLQLQDKTIEQLQADQKTLSANLNAAAARRDSYQTLLNEGVSAIERQSIDERIASGAMSITANTMRTAGAAMDMAPNVFGMAVGGSRWGALTSAIAFGMDASSVGLGMSAEAHTTTEQYRRRQQEWTIQRDAAKHECTQLEAQQRSLAIQLEAARLQKDNVAVQQAQTQAQMDFLKTKFSNEALYSWMQGRLSAVFYQFYDLAITRSMRAQLGYQWETQDTATFIQPGAWDGNYAGLLCGEALLLNLAQMESAYLEWDGRALEVNRTVSMAQSMGLDSAAFNAEVNLVLNGTESSLTLHTLKMGTDPTVFIASLDLNALAIANDYPDTLLGSSRQLRRIKQISVSLPALLGPYQDIQAVLGYSGNGNGIHQSCTRTAISHGVNDSGQLQLDFNDSQYLPFEGLPIDGGGSAQLTLSFPNAGNTGKQRTILQSLNDIVLHIRYTILAD